ncbi:Paramyosin (Fragment) [Linum grandiflorum]
MDSSSSQTFLEAAEETIGDLRTQAKMWERTARKLMLEMDYLKKEHVELSRSQGNQDMEFTEACAERDGLRKEVEQLKQLLAKAKMKPPPLDNPSEGTWQMVKELEREISFQKETSRNLTMQLQRSQESNIELVTVLQDLEETLEKQKVEIESLYDMESRFGELEDAMEVSAESNKNLMVQVQDLLNKELDEVRAGLASKQVENKDLQRCRTGAEARVSVLEKEKEHLAAELETVTRENEIASRCLNDLQKDLAVISSNLETHASVNKSLEKKSLELEQSKQEMEVCLSESRQEKDDLSRHVLELETRLRSICRSEASDHKYQICELEAELKKAESDLNISAQEIEKLKLELEVNVTEMSKQLDESKAEIQSLETIMQANEEEVRDLQRWKSELAAKLTVIQGEKDQLEKKMGDIMTENDIATRRSNELQSELTATRSSLEYQISANEGLERKLEKQKNDLQQQLSGIEQENQELLMSITDLETQLRSERDKLESLKRVLEEKEEQLKEVDNRCNILRQELESAKKEMEVTVSEHGRELTEKMAEIKGLESLLKSQEEENGSLRSNLQSKEEELAAFKENQEKLKSEKRRMAYRFEDYKSSEAKLRTTINELELKLTVSDYKHQILKEEAMKLKVQLLKLGPIHEQVLALKTELNAAKSDKNKLKSSLNLVTTECQQLEAEKSSLLEEIAVLRKCVHQLEEHKRQRFALEEKLKILEKDLMAKEALWQRDEQANDELNKIRKANKQLQKIIEELEDEKDDYAAKARSLEEELVMIQEEEFNLSSSSNVVSIPISSSLLIMKLNFFHLSETFFPDLNRTKTEMLDHLRSNFPSLGMKNPH